MSRAKVAVALAAMVAIAAAGSCTLGIVPPPLQPQQTYFYSSDCSGETPYCINRAVIPGVDEDKYECGDCVSDCDCAVSMYCSRDRANGNIGTCVEFESEGIECIPMTGAELASPEVKETYKCADIYKIPNVDTVKGVNRPASAACVQGKCRMCTSNQVCGNVITGNNDDEFVGPLRRCVYPGNLHTYPSAPWAQGEYQQDRLAVWLAVFFCLFIVLLVFQAMIWMRSKH